MEYIPVASPEGKRQDTVGKLHTDGPGPVSQESFFEFRKGKHVLKDSVDHPLPGLVRCFQLVVVLFVWSKGVGKEETQ